MPLLVRHAPPYSCVLFRAAGRCVTPKLASHQVMSDWGATHSTVASATAGLDMEMPGGGFYTPSKLEAAVANGSISAGAVTEMATRVLTSMYAAGVMDRSPTGTPDANVTSAAHSRLAARLAAAAAVLLKNDGELLPLKSNAKVAVIGLAANCEAAIPSFGFGWPPTVGCLNSGGGSGGVVAAHVDSVLSGVQRRSSASVHFHNGSDAGSASTAAAAADVAIVVVGSTSSEGTDRPSTALPPEQLRYLSAVASAQPRTIVVLMSPGAVEMGTWASTVPAIACFFLPGQAQGEAVASILYGEVNPSGRLPVTMPARENEIGFTRAQYPGIAFADGLQTSYSEGLEVGYRWYEVHSVAPAFCFGHGLSYSVWSYEALSASRTHVNFTLTNSGRVAGAEIVQLYITFPPEAGEPPRQLRGFQKLRLEPSASVDVTLPLTSRAFSTWSVHEHEWAVAAGVFKIEVGASSCDIRASTTLDLVAQVG